MSPEQRAAAWIAMNESVFGFSAIADAALPHFVASVAKIIRAAEDAAYERAAAKFEAFADHAENVGFVAAKSRTGRDKARAAARAYRIAASESRSLKPQKETP